MKVQYISSACVLMEHEGVQVLTDPWLTEGIYYGSWYHYPLPKLGVKDFLDVDYIYITHIHPDHCDIESLRQFPKEIPILIHNYREKFLLRLIRSLGFTHVIEVVHKSPYPLSPHFSVEILAADNCDPTKCGRWFGCHLGGDPTKTSQIDSMAVFQGGNQIAVNTNDCPYELAKPVLEYIEKKWGSVDFLLVGYSGAGPYPQCLEEASSEEKLRFAEEKKKKFLGQALSYIEALQPKAFLPFAGQYTLGGGLAELNPYRGVPELEELPTLFPPLLAEIHSTSKLILLNSGDWYDLSTQKASAEFIPPDPDERRKYVEGQLLAKKMSYEEKEKPLFEELWKKVQLAYPHLLTKQKEYGFFSPTILYLDVKGDELFSISFEGAGTNIVKRGEEKSPYVRISLDPRLFNAILDRKAHWNNAEIGSHLRLLRSPDIYERGIYYFLSYFHVPSTK
jgi:UDP-MurNAc hydroxylase